MNNQKTGNTLNLALDATSREREAFDESERRV